MKHNQLFQSTVVNTCDYQVPSLAVDYLMKKYGKHHWAEWCVRGNEFGDGEQVVDDWLVSIGAKEHDDVIILIDW